MEDLIFPDVKKLIIGYLDSVLDEPVSSRVPSNRPQAFVRVLLAGGQGAVNPALEDRAVTVESWNNDESTAQLTAQKIRSALRNLTLWDGHPVYAYTEWGPPVDLPDESGQPRYTFTFSIRLRATTA